MNTTIATRLLKKKGMTVEHVANGEIGVTMFKASNEGYYDAILVDIRMPVMDGIELIKQTRQNPEYRQIAILANTQYGDPKQEENLLALGANDFIYKPTTPMIVSSRVHSVLKR